MNGFASPLVAEANNATRLHTIRLDREAISGAVSELERQRITLLGERTAAEAEAMMPRWRALAHEITVTAARLQFLEAEAAKVPTMVRQMLPLSRHIGNKSVVGISWQSDPLATLIRDALAEQIISKRDIAEAQR